MRSEQRHLAPPAYQLDIRCRLEPTEKRQTSHHEQLAVSFARVSPRDPRRLRHCSDEEPHNDTPASEGAHLQLGNCS